MAVAIPINKQSLFLSILKMMILIRTLQWNELETKNKRVVEQLAMKGAMKMDSILIASEEEHKQLINKD